LISPQLDIRLGKSWLDKGTFTVAYQNIKESRIQRKLMSLERSYRNENVDVFSFNGDFIVPVSKKENTALTYGYEFLYNEVSSNAFGRTLNVSGNEILGFSDNFSVQTRYPDGGSSYSSFAAYLGYRQDLSTRSTLNSGIRFTKTNLKASWIDQTHIQLPETDIRLDNSAVTATIGYVHKPSKNWQFNTVLASGFRSPNIDDIGRVREKSGHVTVPNIYLKPEFAYSAEVGIQKYFNNKKFRIGFNAYYTLLENYIIRDDFSLDGDFLAAGHVLYDGELENIVANQNRGNAFILGYTANYQGKLSKQLTTNGFVTYTKGRTYDSEEPLSSIPPFFGQFDVNYTHNKIQIGTSFRFNSKKDITDFNFTEGIDNHDLTPIVDENALEDIDKYYGSPSWFAFGINSSYRFNKNWKLQGRISNLFDQHYREFASGISAPGRNFSFSLITVF